MGSAGYVDTRFQPKAARASLVNVTSGQATPENFFPEAKSPTAQAPAPKTEPVVSEPEPDPDLPPALTQGTEGSNSELVRRFDAFRTYVFQRYRVVLEIRSGYRSSAEQAELFRTLPPGRANPPGKSNHEKGEALDYSGYSQEYNQHLAMFGLKSPFPGKEDWHIERTETNTYN